MTRLTIEITRSSGMGGDSEPIPELMEALEVICNLAQLDGALGTREGGFLLTTLGEGEAHECVLGLVFFGAAQLFPLISLERLKSLDLSYHFFTLVTLMAVSFPQHLVMLEPEFLTSIMRYITYAQEKYPFCTVLAARICSLNSSYFFR